MSNQIFNLQEFLVHPDDLSDHDIQEFHLDPKTMNTTQVEYKQIVY